MAVGESTVITFRPNTVLSTVSWYDAFGDYVTRVVDAHSTSVFNCTGITTGIGGRMIVNFDLLTTH